MPGAPPSGFASAVAMNSASGVSHHKTTLNQIKELKKMAGIARMAQQP